MTAKIKAVVDTNIFVSGIISPKGPPRKIIVVAKDRKFDLITSAQINEEILEVLHRNHIYEKYHLTEQVIDDICALLYEGSLIIEGLYSIKFGAPDLKDDKFLATALEGNADYVVSGDPHLLNLGCYHKIEIITA
ncbi:putative toxin-antitoxin system toxin component, PIN family [candidate division KSB1 bacterium]|nr:putative toxin-antitoxin system toxin component, PIN family [candidate division KSB1 bacterium]